MNNGQFSNRQGAAVVGVDAPWSQIEARFRVWSFHVYYEKLFATEMDNTRRFCKALVASSQPIRDRQRVIDWYEGRRHSATARRGAKRGAHANAATLSARGG